MSACDFGVIGLSVMGGNLAKNFANNGFQVSLYNRSAEVTTKLVESNPTLNDRFHPSHDLKSFVAQLKTPRKMILMVKAGEAVDQVINDLLPWLSMGDIIIDGGNSFYKDTSRRFHCLKEKGIHFVGMGVSGGEKGALLGPSLMPGGDRQVIVGLLTSLEKVAAKRPAPCVYYMGKEGAGHFVKMVHNGIEYAEMQIISEIYDFLKKVLIFDNKKISDIFKQFQETELNSYLLEITISILNKKSEDNNQFLVDLISDEASSKGTGKWTIMESLEYDMPVPSIYGALTARVLSSDSHLRKVFSEKFPKKNKLQEQNSLSIISKAMLAGKILSYTQGLNLILKASQINAWECNIVDVVKSWRDGCIIRSVLLEKMITALKESENLLLSSYFSQMMKESFPPLKEYLEICMKSNIAMPALTGASWYFEYLKETRLPTNLIQAQRDYFGAHTYKRVDKSGVFHTNWES